MNGLKINGSRIVEGQEGTYGGEEILKGRFYLIYRTKRTLPGPIVDKRTVLIVNEGKVKIFS